MALKTSWVYWLFRVYALFAILTVVLHVVGWTTGLRHFNRKAFYVAVIGFGIGSIPLLAVFVLSLWRRMKRGS